MPPLVPEGFSIGKFDTFTVEDEDVYCSQMEE